jgi:hypothetical protein
MGFINWMKRKLELTKAKNDAKATALKSYYDSAEFKREVIKESKEGKDNEFGSWLKRVSNNAAKQFENEKISVDNEKLFGKKKE